MRLKDVRSKESGARLAKQAGREGGGGGGVGENYFNFVNVCKCIMLSTY